MLTKERAATYYVAMSRTHKPYRTSSRITEDCRRLIDLLMAKFGLSESSVIELAIREYAEKRGVEASRREPKE